MSRNTVPPGEKAVLGIATHQVDTHSRMAHCSETHDDAFEVTARAGCATVFQKMFLSKKEISAKDVPSFSNHSTTWYTGRKPIPDSKRWSRDGLEDEHGKAASERAGHPPFSLGRSGAPGKEHEQVTTPAVGADEACAELRRRFKVAHRIAPDPAPPRWSIDSPSPPVRLAPAWGRAAARRHARDSEWRALEENTLLIQELGCHWVVAST
ncbi:hypothetical protein T484DRAFT_1951299 [Baffinella frigidus]|nr:hypothetical protein T484DRAFT_1951299 [Cryptophyta sp. CCMP2293]